MYHIYFSQDLSVDDTVIQKINEIGDKLIRQEQGKNMNVEKRKQDITDK